MLCPTLYNCVTILERKAQAVGQPYVGKDSVEGTNIGGKPALTINGAWKTRGESSNQSTILAQPEWDSSILPSLIFETNSIVVQLDAWGQGSMSNFV